MNLELKATPGVLINATPSVPSHHRSAHPKVVSSASSAAMNEDEHIANHTNYRRIVVNGMQTTKFVTNAISTTKYTLLSFLYLFLWEQSQNLTNCFFLLVSIIQQFPEASFMGRYTTLIPLCIILSFSAIKEIVEDVNRNRGDRKVNRRMVEILKGTFGWSLTEWRQVQVGDVVRVHNGEFFPADLLLLKSSAEAGICYIETVNLDGENNLKIRRALPKVDFSSTADLTDASTIHNFGGIVECDQPNEKIYSFNGVFKANNNVTVALTADHILLRGAILRNTQWIVGLVIYTGSETKIMKNSSSTRLKRSSVSTMVNSHIIFLFVLFIIYSLVHWFFAFLWNNTHYADMWYVPLKKQNITDSSTIVEILVFGVMYSILIPISLQVMQEVARFIQGIFINNDLDMYYESKDTPAMVKTSGLNEDLALVKYIFADKTGTLTKNILEFKCCSVDDAIYDLEKIRHLSNSEKEAANSLRHLFIAVSVCPGVVPVQRGDSISYYASSPDQKALILAAHEFGCTLTNRTHNQVDLKLHGQLQQYEVLCDFEFSSDRKRTSTIVRNSSKELILYTMGADDVILPRCQSVGENIETTKKHSESFARQGLRSLFIAMKRINQIDFDSWYPAYKTAYEALSSKEELFEKAESSILKHLTLLGCTAVEDMLQDEVPETIESLLGAGINIWILTGDKQETAINIGYSCRLLSDTIPLILLNSNDLLKMRAAIIRFKRNMGAQFGHPGNNYTLLVTGECLNMLFESRLDIDNFILLMLSCRSVICCRTTPKQKALVVKNVQKYTKFVTLAIGDGANDVAMIQTASIGVGISGMEGLQAANAADYAIGQFKYLKKLLLVHGTWSYNRICKMIYFIYYKNITIATIQLYYTSTNGWSGQLFLDRWAKALFNVLLTSAPTLALGIFEQNLPSDVLLKNPFVYTRNKWFDEKTFFICMFNALAHSVLLSWLALQVFGSGSFWSSGINENYMVLGNVVYTSLILIVCLKCALHTYHWTNLTLLFVASSSILWIFVFTTLSYLWPWIHVGEDMPRMIQMLFKSPTFWLFIVFIIVAVLLFDAVAVILYRIFCEPVIETLRNRSLRCKNHLPIVT